MLTPDQLPVLIESSTEPTSTPGPWMPRSPEAPPVGPSELVHPETGEPYTPQDHLRYIATKSGRPDMAGTVTSEQTRYADVTVTDVAPVAVGDGVAQNSIESATPAHESPKKRGRVMTAAIAGVVSLIAVVGVSRLGEPDEGRGPDVAAHVAPAPGEPTPPSSEVQTSTTAISLAGQNSPTSAETQTFQKTTTSRAAKSSTTRVVVSANPAASRPTSTAASASTEQKPDKPKKSTTTQQTQSPPEQSVTPSTSPPDDGVIVR